MESFFKDIVDTFTKSEDLIEFATLWSLEEDPYVKEKIFQLKCQELFNLIDQDVSIPTPEPMYILPSSNQSYGSSVQDSLSSGIPQQPVFFRPWEDIPSTSHLVPYSNAPTQDHLTPEVTDPSQPKCSRRSQNNITSPTSPQPGPSGINSKRQRDLHFRPEPCSPQPGPSGINQDGRGTEEVKPYTYGLKRQRVYAKNKAIDNTYQVKFNDQWQGEKLKDLNRDLHQMFDDVLNNVRGNPNDLGRAVVRHGGLKIPIVIPLQPWDKLDSQTILDGITKVLNSNEELIVDDSLEVSVGSIEIPSGSGGDHLPITTLFGPNNSLKRKRSIFEVISDKLCLPIAIA